MIDDEQLEEILKDLPYSIRYAGEIENLVNYAKGKHQKSERQRKQIDDMNKKIVRQRRQIRDSDYKLIKQAKYIKRLKRESLRRWAK